MHQTERSLSLAYGHIQTSTIAITKTLLLSSSPSWRMIRLFQQSRLLPEITQDNIHIQTPKLQSKCHSRNITTIALKQFTAQCQSSKFSESPNHSALNFVLIATSLLLGVVYC